MYLYVQCVLHKTYVTLYTVCVWHSNAIGLQENGDSSLELQLGFLRTPSVQRLRTLWAQKPVWGSNCVFLFSKVLIWKCQMLSTFKTGVTILDFFLNRFSTSCRFLNPNYHRQNFKVSSVQEACAKCFAVHILKVEILQITWKKWNKLSIIVYLFKVRTVYIWYIYSNDITWGFVTAIFCTVREY